MALGFEVTKDCSVGMTPRPSAELAELVNNHLSRGTRLDIPLAAIVNGLAHILNAFIDAQEVADSGRIIAGLRSGCEQVGYGLEQLRGQPGFEGLVSFAERQRAFASTLIDEVIRLQADESTLV